MVAGQAVALAASTFTLGWTHSVEHTAWRETWEVTPAGLALREAAVQGSGAGMDPGDGARLKDGFWVWAPDLAPVPELALGASGATGAGWRLCGLAEGCRELGAAAGPAVILSPCG